MNDTAECLTSRSNGELLDAYRRGNGTAFAVFMERVIPALTTELKVRLIRWGRLDWVEDLCQEVFFKAVEQIRHAEATGSDTPDLSLAWLITVASNQAVDWMRGEREVTTATKAEQDRVDWQQAQDRNDRLNREVVKVLLRRLPPKNAAMLRELYVLGNSREEAATNLCISLSAADKRRMRGLESLHEMVKADPGLAIRLFGPED